MASAGVKRPSDFDLSSLQISGSNSCGSSTPIWPQHANTKRRCLTNHLTAAIHQSTATTTTTTNNTLAGFQNQHQTNQQQQPNQHNQTNSPFKASSNIFNSLNEEIASILRNEAMKAHNHNNELPVLTIRQTQLICEKLLKEKEFKLREEYDKILIHKLAEQYETFVKYTHDHIEKRYNETNPHEVSYFS